MKPWKTGVQLRLELYDMVSEKNSLAENVISSSGILFLEQSVPQFLLRKKILFLKKRILQNFKTVSMNFPECWHPKFPLQKK
ncbi:MAG: hypothetical protein Ct9H90mP8_2910 [Pseudomonadota bacterium]|nr:MAG: hypothetical protein Ct9H90mP8_2910 [Pseudomonadota bacterium]